MLAGALVGDDSGNDNSLDVVTETQYSAVAETQCSELDVTGFESSCLELEVESSMLSSLRKLAGLNPISRSNIWQKLVEKNLVTKKDVHDLNSFVEDVHQL